MAALLQYPRYMRLFSAFRAEHLLTPKFRRIERIALPKGSVLHYMPETETEIGPSRDNPFIRNAPRLVYIDHVDKLTSMDGGPRPTYVLPGPMKQEYRRKNMQLRPMTNYEMTTRDENNLVVVSYALLGHMYKYMRSALSRYWFWKNIRQTQWDTISNLNTPHPRHHFVILDVPMVLPSLSQLRRAETRMTPELAKTFNSRERLDILDFFTWLGPHREASPMNRLNPEKFDTTNIVLRKDTGWIVLNLGQVDSWRKSDRVSTEDSHVQAHPVDGMRVSVGHWVGPFQEVHEQGAVISVTTESFCVKYDDGREEVFAFDDNISMEANNGKGIDPKILQVRILALLLKMIQATNPIIDSGNQIATPEEEEKELAEAERELPEDHEIELQILRDTDSDKLLVEEEEVLSEELDKMAKVEEKAIMTDEDGELIIEASEGEPDELPQAVGNQNVEQTLTSSIDSKLEELLEKKLISPAEYRRMQRLSTSYQRIPDPWGRDKTVEESMELTDDDLVFDERTSYPDQESVRDKSMLQSTVEKLDSQYIEKVMKADILNSVLSVQKAGVMVTGYSVRVVQDAVSNYEVHTVQLTPVMGKPSTIQIRVPIVDKRGVYVSNGQRYRLRAQKADVPIRKINPSRVAISSYYAKIFVDRSQRAVFNYDNWIIRQIKERGQDAKDESVRDLRIADVADYSQDLPRIYAIISSQILEFTTDQGRFWFDIKHREKSKMFTAEEIPAIEAKVPGSTAVGKKGRQFIVVDKHDMFYYVDGASGNVSEIGRIEQIIGVPEDRVPVSVAELSVFGKSIPMGLVLGYLLGFDRLAEMTKVKFRVVPLGERAQVGADEFALKFLDETLVFSKADPMSGLLFGGYQQYHRNIKQYSRRAFNTKDVFFSVLDANGIGLRYLRELDLMNAMFVDPVTKGVLEWMKEPTEFIPLLIRACEMLMARYVPTEVQDANGTPINLERAKGYERIPGAIYGELVRAVRVYNSRSANANSQVTMNPHEVWTNIVQDPAAALIDDINPIQNLKQKEIITYGGRGGRSSRSMTADARLYKESDIGFISEATVDSGDVAVITYMTPNANLTSVRGTVRKFDKEEDGSSSMLSTAALISPCADRDDPKRVNFIGIQQSHVIATEGYRESPISTGYDHVISHRVDDIFAFSADKDGKVIEKSDDHLVIEYEDGTQERLDLTTQYGISAGSVYPQPQATTFDVGDVVKKGDILKYNPGFFKPSRFDKRQVMWKAGVIARTALMEASYTLEDSSAIDDWLSQQLVAPVTKVKTVVVRFDQTVRNLVKVGDSVDISSILCMIEDAVTADAGLFGEDDLATLARMSAAAPQAGVAGKVEKIEVFYHGDPDDMSDSLLQIAQVGDRERRKKSKQLGKPNITGQVDQSLRIDGNGLEMDHVAIKIYITYREGMGVGDKAVFCNQMKTVVGHRLSGVNETISGRPINAIFGAKSIMDRIVLSPMLIGMGITVQIGIGELAAEMWMGNETQPVNA